MNDLNDVVTNVAMLQRDVAQFNKLVDRIDTTIQKLTEVSSNVSKLLAVQDNRIMSQEKLTSQFERMFEKRKEETDDNVKQINDKIDTVESTLYKEVETNHDKVILKLESLSQEIKNQNTSTNDRISKIEKWMWTGAGILMVITILVDKVRKFG